MQACPVVVLLLLLDFISIKSLTMASSNSLPVLTATTITLTTLLHGHFNGIKTFNQWWMRVMKGRVERVRIQVALVFNVQLDQSRLEQLSVAQIDSKSIGLEFIVTTVQVEQESNDDINGAHEKTEL